MINKDIYIQERLDKQIEWYNKKSGTSKIMYIVLSISILILTSSIPVLTSINNINEYVVKIIIGSFGAISAILTGIINIMKYKENWIRYRQLTQSLEHEKMLYCTKSSGYGESNALDKLIEKCEKLISMENDMWVSSSKK